MGHMEIPHGSRPLTGNSVTKWQVETQVLAGFALALTVLAVVGVLVYRATTDFIETNAAAARSRQALTALEAVYSLANQAETQQRGYLLLGDPADLVPRQAAVAQLNTRLTELKQLLADDPQQSARLPELERRVADRLTLLDWVLEARRTQGFEAGRQRLAAGPGRHQMQKLRETVTLIQQAEQQRLETRQQAAQQSARQTLGTLALLLAATVASLSVLYARIRREIRERRAAQETSNRLLHEVESANEELRNFAYVVSHDLKAPLRAIGSLAGWLQSDYADRLDDEGREHLRLLTSRVQRMDGLINGILEYSRVGRVRETRVAVDTHEVVREAIELLAPPPHIRVHVSGRLPTVVIEPTRIRQVFQNLLSNAIKYMDKPEGTVHVTCRALDNSLWEFSVADNGPGIEARHRERIFQLFQTLAPRDRVESTGVGLALVKKIVELYGGHIRVESVPGEGSTFYFTLPRQPAEIRSTDAR